MKIGNSSNAQRPPSNTRNGNLFAKYSSNRFWQFVSALQIDHPASPYLACNVYAFACKFTCTGNPPPVSLESSIIFSVATPNATVARVMFAVDLIFDAIRSFTSNAQSLFQQSLFFLRYRKRFCLLNCLEGVLAHPQLPANVMIENLLARFGFWPEQREPLAGETESGFRLLWFCL